MVNTSFKYSRRFFFNICIEIGLLNAVKTHFLRFVIITTFFVFCQINFNNLFSWDNLLFWVSDCIRNFIVL